jgi:nicotinate-nucleotide adenylyltransferase
MGREVVNVPRRNYNERSRVSMNQKPEQELRIGVMGGSFNPIHIGHLVAAQEALVTFGMQRIVFVPTSKSPFKLSQELADNQHRLKMLELAIAANPDFYVSEFETRRPGLSYTIDTLKHFKRRFGKHSRILFITGADAVRELEGWDRVAEYHKYGEVVAATRPKYVFDTKFIDRMMERYRLKITYLEIPALAISSTDIRERIKSGRPVKYLVPEGVEAYIRKYGLYL